MLEWLEKQPMEDHANFLGAKFKLMHELNRSIFISFQMLFD